MAKISRLSFDPLLEHTVVLDFCFNMLCCTYTADDIIIFLYKSEVGAVAKPTQNDTSSTKEALQLKRLSQKPMHVSIQWLTMNRTSAFEEFTSCPLYLTEITASLHETRPSRQGREGDLEHILKPLFSGFHHFRSEWIL